MYDIDDKYYPYEVESEPDEVLHRLSLFKSNANNIRELIRGNQFYEEQLVELENMLAQLQGVVETHREERPTYRGEDIPF